MSGRLTWNPLAPAPYESAWSVFLKLCRINFMNMPELEDLIQREPRQKERNEIRDHLDSRWVDFDRYASLVGVERERLTQGFLDQLGIVTASERAVKYGVRHCPRCCELGYHCVLFDLTIIDECPWHRCKLTEPSMRRNSMSAVNLYNKYHIKKFLGIWSECPMSIDRYVTVSRLNAIDDTLKYTIIGYCKEFLDWWAEVRNTTMDCPSFVPALRCETSNTSFPASFTPWLLGFAQNRAKKKLYWKFSVPQKPARVISRNCTIENKIERSNCYLTDDIGRSFRSIRRHIYKRYLRAHHVCINRLLNLSHDETQFLHSGRACTPAVAFLTWWMSIEGISNIEGLRSKKIASIPLRLMAPALPQNSFSLKDQLVWTYDSFFGLLAALEEAREHHWRLVIYMREFDICDGFLLSKIMNCLGESEGIQGTAENSIVQILRPEPISLKEKKCCQWGVFPQSVNSSDDTALDHALTWSWSHGPVSQQRCLFKFTQSERDGQPMFRYFYV